MQFVDDVAGVTLAAASTMDKGIAAGCSVKDAGALGRRAAEAAAAKGIKTVVFDRGGFRYHGRVKAVADAAREAGLCF